MKKLLYSIAAVLAFTACTDDYTDWASPLSNAEETAIAISGFSASSTAAIDLNSLEADSAQVFALATSALPDGYTLENVRVELTPNDVEGATTTTVSTGVAGLMSAADLQTLVQNAYGRNPTARTFTAHVYANAVSGGKAVLIDAGEVVVTVTPEAPYISEHYYLIGAPNNWTLGDTSYPFNHSDADVYDDPEFTITFAVEDGDCWFAIADDKTMESGEWSDLLGCAEGNGKNGMEGQIARRTELSDDGSWCVSVAGDAKYIRMTINMMDYSYKIEKLNFGEYIYLPGSANGWTFDQDFLRGANFDGEYLGFAVLGGEWGWKVTTVQDWVDDSTYGAGSSDGVIAIGGGNIMEGSTATLYYANINLVNLTYSLTPIESVSIIGAPTGDSSWSTDLDLTQSSDNQKVWTYTGHLEAGEFKFRMNHGWDVNLGGATATALEQNGANLNVEAAGDYTVTLTLSANGVSSYTIQ